jgi:hypothetical protein
VGPIAEPFVKRRVARRLHSEIDGIWSMQALQPLGRNASSAPAVLCHVAQTRKPGNVEGFVPPIVARGLRRARAAHSRLDPSVLATKSPANAGLFVVERDGGPVYYAKWRHEGRQIKRRIGPAWVERGDSAAAGRRATRHPGWIKRRGRAAEGVLTEDAALASVCEIVGEWDAEQARQRAGLNGTATFDDAAAAWPSTPAP